VTLPAPATRPAGNPAGTNLATGTGRLEVASLGPITLQGGTTLPDLTVAYRHDGLGPEEAPQILVMHALTGSADAAGDWWEPLIGEGRALDTTRYGVVCANLLGGRYGSSGPTSLHPRTGRPYGPAFPNVTVVDQAIAEWRLLDALGIDDVALAVGGSLGGMVALEVALVRPSRVRHVMPIAAPAAIGAMAAAWNHLQVQLIEQLGLGGLSLARQLAMTTYRSETDFDERFGGLVEDDGRPSIVSYLDHQGDKLIDRFDPATYRVLVGAMDSHDIGRDRGGIDAALATLAAHGVRITGVGIQGDILFGPRQVRALVDAAEAASVRTAYRFIDSTKGHDAFLVEWDQLTAILREALADYG
jgi:homoserine O-acetyltransferase/O-succinyltransferase